MNKDLNDKMNIEIDQEKETDKKFLEKNKIYRDINFSNISNKETTTISSETEESFQYNKMNKKNVIKDELKGELKNKGADQVYLLQEKEKKKKMQDKKIKKYEYYKSEYLSQKNNINVNAPKIPNNYNISFNIDKNTKQKNIGEEEYMKDLYKTKYKKNESYKEISTISHDKLLHLIINENIYEMEKNNKKYNEISITERFRHKFLTTVYFFPKK